MPNHTSQQPKAVTGFTPPTYNTVQQPTANVHTRLRQAEPVDWTAPFPTHATSAPIPIQGCEAEPAMPSSPRFERRRCILPGVYEAEPRIHHRLDNVTDYCAPGFHGWEFAQRARVKREEANVGKILAGEWPPSEPWEKQVVKRKDPDFSRDPRPQREENEQNPEAVERLLLLKWHAAKQLKKMKGRARKERGYVP